MARSSPRQGRLASPAAPSMEPATGARASIEAAGAYRFSIIFVAVTCAVAPAYVVRWHVGPFPTTLLENAILLTFVVFALESFRAGIRPAWRSSLTLPALLFLVAGVISVVVAPDRRAALGLFRAYLVEPIGFGLVVLNVALTARRALAVVGGLWVGGLVAGLVNAAVVLVAISRGHYDVIQTPPVVIYNVANADALYLVPLVAVAGAIALHLPRRPERLLAAGFLLIGIPCVLLTFSRGGYLALAAVAIGLAISHRRRLLMLAGAAASAGLLMLIPAIRHRVAIEVNFNDPRNSLVARFQLWSAALQMLRQHPIFGAGLSGFSTLVAPYWNPSHSDRYTYPHNILLNFWSETGLLGVAAFGWILGTGFVRTWHGWRLAAPEWSAIHVGVLLAIVAVMVHGLVDVPYWKNDLSLEFWALLSLSFAPAALRPREPSS